ncbi:MAG TPA: phosphoribosylformylglycinamidine synthase I, partial [Rectinemataceae bacterium]|nr:phosphoribosylformylglycinamidine synthase I [Rectinemataceae bacterium]
NRDIDAAYALELAGADVRITHVNELRKNRNILSESRILVIPGGFSYADALGAGRLFALDIASFFKEEVREFVEKGRPVIGICNGFQTLVKAGILPDIDVYPGTEEGERYATLAANAFGRFECRWVTMKIERSPCIWTDKLDEPIVCPVAHGEGRFLVREKACLDAIREKNLIAFTYALPDGSLSAGRYPDNPNGSVLDIAGICNAKGNVLGLMPHPEDNVFSGPGARAYRGGRPGGGLDLFANGVRYANQM